VTSPHIAVLGLACLLACAPSSRGAEPAREVHGSADAMALPGIALAWGVLRAPKEDDTAVVLRVEPDVRRYAWVEVVGRDPFTQNRAVRFPATAVGGAFDVRIPRARIADHPRTEILLWPPAAPPPAAPALVVYFAGVPDTTPEVVRADELVRSLDARIARARAEARNIAP